jgi:hypothetical protein
MSVEPQSSPQAKPADALGFGIAMLAMGLYIILAATGVLPMPDGGAGAPSFVLVIAGLAFVFAGCSLMIRARAGANDNDGDLPAAAPRWTHISYRVIGIAVAASLAMIGTWIAIGSGPRLFDMSVPLAGTAPAGNTLGRTIFGLGAVVVWIYVIALTVGTVRKIFDRREGR